MANVIYDIESVVEHKWQMDLINKTGGFKPGEFVVSVGRQTGKSLYLQYVKDLTYMLNGPAYSEMDDSIVDNERWFCVKCNDEVAKWLRTQNKNYWYEHNTSKPIPMFDVQDKLYTMLKLTFTP